MKKRLILFVCSFAAIYVFNFFIPRLMPGDPFAYTSSVSGEDLEGMSQEQLEIMRAYYNLDKPLGQQFKDTLSRNLKGDLGQSIYYKKPVAQVLGERLPWTLYIMFSSLLLSLLLGCGLALWCVRRRKADRFFYPLLSVFGEIPAYLVGILLLFLVAARVSWIPLSGNLTPFMKYDSFSQQLGDILLHSLMPLCAMVLTTLPQFFFTARASFLDIIQKPYILTARSKGLSEGRIRLFYILKNAARPIVARLFLSVGAAIGGTILIENVFSYPGLGRVLREAVLYRDYPMIQGVFLLSAGLTLVSLLIADLINAHSGGRAEQ
jgi:peptide/nickel transport system permease protein